MMDRRRNVLVLLGWVTLIQMLSILVSVGMVFLTFDPFGGDGGMLLFGVLFLFVWAAWGYFLPRRIQPTGAGSMVVLGLWSIALLVLWFCLQDWLILFHFPQMLTGMWLAQLWPGNPYNAWYQQTLEPVMINAAHVLMPAMLGLGLWLRNREEAARNEGK